MWQTCGCNQKENKVNPIALYQHLSPIYRFFEWFAEAWQRSGGELKLDVNWPRKVRALLGRPLGFAIGSDDKPKLLVCGCHRIESCAWPWNYQYEIIPVMWDMWPGFYQPFAKFIRRNRVKTVFCTAQQSCKWIQDKFPNVKVIWMPEAIDVDTFPCGPNLIDRETDVICYGRNVPQAQTALQKLSTNGEISYVTKTGPTFEELSTAIRNAKISICYPRCDTNPEKARGVETLTQRYWEAMCSGTLMVGKAPKELIEVCGYNPVVELGLDVTTDIKKILANIASYQELVDKNRKCAEERGTFDSRMKIIKDGLGLNAKC